MRPSAHLLPARCSKRRSSRFHGETHNAKARLCCRLISGDFGHWLYPGHHLRSAWLGPATRAPLPDRHGLGYYARYANLHTAAPDDRTSCLHYPRTQSALVGNARGSRAMSAWGTLLLRDIGRSAAQSVRSSRRTRWGDRGIRHPKPVVDLVGHYRSDRQGTGGAASLRCELSALLSSSLGFRR